MTNTKKCTVCGETKELTEFYKVKANAGRKERLTSGCKVCNRAKVKDKRLRDIEKDPEGYKKKEGERKKEARARGVGTWEDLCNKDPNYKEKYNARRRASIAKNPEAHREKKNKLQQAYRARGKNTWEDNCKKDPTYKEKINAQCRERRKKNPEVYKALSRRDNYRRRGKGKWKPEYEKILEEYNHKYFESEIFHCEYCLEPIKGRYDMDHIIPVSKEGTGDLHNLAISCVSCNRGYNGKFEKPLSEWKPEAEWYFSARNSLCLDIR